MVGEPKHVKQLSQNHVSKKGLMTTLKLVFILCSNFSRRGKMTERGGRMANGFRMGRGIARRGARRDISGQVYLLFNQYCQYFLRKDMENFEIQEQYLISILFFLWDGVSWPLLCLCGIFMLFEWCLDSNRESLLCQAVALTTYIAIQHLYSDEALRENIMWETRVTGSVLRI